MDFLYIFLKGNHHQTSSSFWSYNMDINIYAQEHRTIVLQGIHHNAIVLESRNVEGRVGLRRNNRVVLAKGKLISLILEFHWVAYGHNL